MSAMLLNIIFAVAVELEWPQGAVSSQKQFSWFLHASWRSWLSVTYLGLARYAGDRARRSRTPRDGADARRTADWLLPGCSTCVAFMLYFYLLSTIGSVRQTMVGFLLPVVGVLLGVLVAGDWDNTGWLYKFLTCLGAVMIACGIYFVNFAPSASKKDGPAADERRPLLHSAEGINNDGVRDIGWIDEAPNTAPAQHARPRAVSFEEIMEAPSGPTRYSSTGNVAAYA